MIAGVVEESGLADARFAAQDQRTTRSLPDGGKQPIDACAFRSPPEQHRFTVAPGRGRNPSSQPKWKHRTPGSTETRPVGTGRGGPRHARSRPLIRGP